jgi:uncharacterized protein YndB with AHSA1/START domain
MTTSSTADREIVISREMNAPRALVFEAWTKPEHLANWWGPNGYTVTTQEASITVGGRWVFIMRGPEGVDYPTAIVYHEITPPSKLRYGVSGLNDPEGRKFTSTVTFEEVSAGKTRVTMVVLFGSAEELEVVLRERGAKQGGEQTIAKLAAYVEQLNK